MNKINAIALASVIIVAIISIAATITIDNYHVIQSMERNVNSALEKGIDPIAIRCAYADSTDDICLVYSAKLTK
jgi:hypothetical protein